MQKINFKNLPDTSTPLNATNLNLMQDNIESAIDTVASDIPTVVDSLDGSSTTDAPSVHATKLLNTYSTDEIKIGTWIDGKPLYRKVIQLANASSLSLPISTGIDISNLSVDRAIKVFSLSNKNNKNTVDTGNYYSSGTDYCRTFYRKGTPDTLQIRANAGQVITDFYIIFEYTKTTD